MSIADIRIARGINVKIGGRVRYTGGDSPQLGTVVGTRNGYLRIKLDGEKQSYSYHPTWKLEFLPDSALECVCGGQGGGDVRLVRMRVDGKASGVDVPATSKQASWSKLYGSGAIYAITPMAEDLVKLKAESLQVAPLSAWDLPEEWRDKIRGRLPAPVSTSRQDFENDEEDFPC